MGTKSTKRYNEAQFCYRVLKKILFFTLPKRRMFFSWRSNLELRVRETGFLVISNLSVLQVLKEINESKNLEF